MSQIIDVGTFSCLRHKTLLIHGSWKRWEVLINLTIWDFHREGKKDMFDSGNQAV